MLDETSITILRKIFVENTSSTNGINAIKFRAQHFEHLELIDSLVSSRLIEIRDGKYSLPLATLPEIADATPQVSELFDLCEHLVKVLRQAYLENPGANILLNDLSKLSNLSKERISVAIPYLWEASVINGYSTDLTTSESYVLPVEKLLRYKSFSQVVEEIRGWSSKTSDSQKFAMPLSSISTLNGNELTFEQLLHPAITTHALPQYNDGHLRDAVLNSITAVFDLIRQKTGLREDGNKLIGKAFSLEKPFLILSEIKTESGRSEQQGFIQIFLGVFQGIRNPKAHSLSHDLTPTAAAQYLVLASLLARRIDEAKLISQ